MQLSSPVVRAAVVVALQGVGLLVVAVAYAVGGLRGDAESVAGSEIGALMLGLAGAGLLLVARGLLRRRRWARSPAVVVQLLLGLTALSLLQTLPVAAGIGLVLAAVVLYQLATPEARLDLGPGRERD